MTPFDIAILFGQVRPISDANGQRSLVEVYDRQVYLSHLQAGALYEALGRSLGSLGRQEQHLDGQGQAEKAEEPSDANDSQSLPWMGQTSELKRCEGWHSWMTGRFP